MGLENWDVIDSEVWKPVKGYAWVKAVARIRKEETGEVRAFNTQELLEDGADYPGVFNWEENNFSCDCNRENFFEQAGGNMDFFDSEEKHCSDGRFRVNLVNPKNGEVYYKEFDE